MRTSFVLTAAFMVSSVFAAPKVVTQTAVVYVTEEAPAVTVKAAPTPCDNDKKISAPKVHHWVNKHKPQPAAPKPTYVVPEPVYEAPKPIYEAPKESYTPKPTKKVDPLPTPSSLGKTPQGMDRDLCLSSHNTVRANHGAENLIWSFELEEWAQQASDACAGHSGRQGVGENWASSSGQEADVAAFIVDMWYGSEVNQYKSNPGAFSMATGHFTQIVWKTTKEVGCGLTKCPGRNIFICQYREPGNMAGAFYENVQL